MGDITKNFSFYEFRPKGEDKSWTPCSEYQKALITILAENLQVVRNKMPSGSYIKITGGIRTAGDYERIKRQGYNPSPTSDHFTGNVVRINNMSTKKAKFGDYYSLSTGAVDMVPVNMDIDDFYKLIVDMTFRCRAKFGQVILETGKHSRWVHISNDPMYLFCPEIAKLLSRKKFLVSKDNGKSYQEYDVSPRKAGRPKKEN